MALDKRGDIAVAEVVLYVPILIVSVILIFRHGFTRQAGWIFLLLLSVVRIVGGIIHVVSEQNPSNLTLQIVYNVLESAGLSPLMLATLGFLGTVAQNTLENYPLMRPRVFHLLHLLGSAAVGLAAYGGVKAGDAKSQSDLNSGANLRHIGAILFAVLLGCIAGVTLFAWAHRNEVLKVRRRLLMYVTATLPFLFIRVLYTVLASFAPSSFTISDTGRREVNPSFASSPLAKFSSPTGDWQIYLVMSVLAEYAVVLVYTGAGLRLPLKQDEAVYQKANAFRAMELPDVADSAYAPLNGHNGRYDV